MTLIFPNAYFSNVLFHPIVLLLLLPWNKKGKKHKNNPNSYSWFLYIVIMVMMLNMFQDDLQMDKCLLFIMSGKTMWVLRFSQILCRTCCSDHISHVAVSFFPDQLCRRTGLPNICVRMSANKNISQ